MHGLLSSIIVQIIIIYQNGVNLRYYIQNVFAIKATSQSHQFNGQDDSV